MKRQNQKGMILAIDMGNTNIVIGCVDDEKIYLLIAICNVTKKAFKLLGVSNDMLINKIQKLTVS